MKVGVLYGGWSDEAEISRKSGKAVLAALRQAGISATGIEVTRKLPQELVKNKIDFCFIALHGKFGEDGTVQGLCEMMRIPYSGSGVLASALSMDKARTKTIVAAAGVPTPPSQIIFSAQDKIRIPLPFVVKPVDGGSAIGVSIVRKPSQIKSAVALALRHSPAALAEKFIAGTEVTAPVLDSQALPVIEIVPRSAFYDFKAKYAKGGSEHVLPARISQKATQEVKRFALSAHRALGCRAYSRSDFIVDRAGKPHFLEINTVPGMTETSLFPESAKAAGYSFPEMILKVIGLSKS